MANEDLRKEILQKLYDKGIRKVGSDEYRVCEMIGKSGKKLLDYYISSVIQEVFVQIIGYNKDVDIAKELGIVDWLSIVDWVNVPEDTKVLVSNDGKRWRRGYFYKYSNDENNFCTFVDGATSFSAAKNYDGTPVTCNWKYCKLAEVENEV